MSGMMDKAKSFFSSGQSTDSSGAAATSTSESGAPKLSTDPEVEDQEKSHGWAKDVLARVGGSAVDDKNAVTTASGTDDSAAPISAATGTAGVTQEPAKDVEQATYTDRSYKVGEGVQPLQEDVTPLPRESYPTELADRAKQSAAAGSTDDTFSGTTAGITAGAVGVGAAGAGAAALASQGGEKDDEPEYLKNRDGGISKAAAAAPSETPGSGHVPGEFPSEEAPAETSKSAEEPSSSAAFLGTAAGAGGAATGLAAIGGDNSTKDTDATGVPTQGADRERYFGRPEASPPASPTTAHTTETTSTERAPIGKGTEEESHTGRDAALAGGAAAGAGALGFGAYEASKDKDVPASSTATESVPSKPEPGSDPAGDILKERQQDSTAPSQMGTTEQPSGTSDAVTFAKQPEEESHLGRDAAIAGGGTVGAGALGYGAYEASKDQDITQPSTSEAAAAQPSGTETARGYTTSGPTQPSATETARGYSTTEPAATTQPTTTEPAASEKQPEEESHTGRDAAIAGGAVAATGAAGYGAYELSKEEEDGKKEAERQAAEQKEAAKRQQEQQKEAEKRQKEQQKEQEKKEKEAKKEQEKREKEAKKEEEKKQKEAEKAEKERKKEAEKREKEEKKAAEKREQEEKKEAEKREKERQAEAAAAARREEDEKKAAEEQAKKEEESSVGRDAAIAGGATAAAGAAGYGAYELSKDDETNAATSTTEDPATKEVPSQPYSPYSSKGQQAAADASAARDAREEPVAAGTTQDTSRYVDHRQDPAPTTQTAEKSAVDEPATRQTTEPRIESEHSYGEDAAIAGGVGAGAVGAGVAGSSILEGSSLPKGDSDVSAYEHSGKGTVTTQAELDQRFKTYGLHDENPERTQAKMAEIKRLEEEKAKFKGTEETPKKKESFLHKILHPHKHRKSSAASDENAEPKSPGQKEVTTQSGAPVDTGGDAHHLTVDEAHKMGLPIDEHGHIVLKNAAAPADAPHLTITEKPGGGLETSQK